MQTPRLNGPKSKGNLRSPAPWPSGKAADCKSAIRRFDSDRRLYTAAASCSLPATGLVAETYLNRSYSIQIAPMTLSIFAASNVWYYYATQNTGPRRRARR